MNNKAIITLLLPAITIIGLLSVGSLPVQAGAPTPTPTYDPLEEPPLPENPTELELGRNLYWHWCMPCHGDVGQGLTDEFRGIWEPDHQNCWDRGCHAGRPGDMGFKIPTFVPPIVLENHLADFSSLQSLTDYLNSTHPPQHPGILEEKEYQAIAAYVFTMNQREPEDSPSPNCNHARPIPHAHTLADPQPDSTLHQQGCHPTPGSDPDRHRGLIPPGSRRLQAFQEKKNVKQMNASRSDPIGTASNAT